MDHIVVDVEIIEDPKELGWDATDRLGVAVACVWEYATRRMRIYGPEDLEDLRERILRAERITGFNNLNFDFPVIFGHSKGMWMFQSVREQLEPKTNDILRRIWQSNGLDPDNFRPKTHGGYSLDRVAQATLGVGKIGHGADAPQWYGQGLIQKVVNYCADDVALTRDLADFVDLYGYVITPGPQQYRLDITV